MDVLHALSESRPGHAYQWKSCPNQGHASQWMSCTHCPNQGHASQWKSSSHCVVQVKGSPIPGCSVPALQINASRTLSDSATFFQVEGGQLPSASLSEWTAAELWMSSTGTCLPGQGPPLTLSEDHDCLWTVPPAQVPAFCAGRAVCARFQ